LPKLFNEFKGREQIVFIIVLKYWTRANHENQYARYRASRYGTSRVKFPRHRTVPEYM